MGTQETISENTNRSGRTEGRLKQTLRICLNLILPVLIVAVSIGFFKHQRDTRPKAQRRKPSRQAYLVTAEPVHQTTRAASVSAMGTVLAAKEITVSPEVTGVITSVDSGVVPGGVVREGQILFTIDSRDYEAVVKQRESDLGRAWLEFKLESGNQAIARREYEMLEEIIHEQDQELVLRQPHLESARASLEAARAALEKARLDVRRCTIQAPFNAVIREKFADLGARVSPASPLVGVFGTDEFWVRAAVPVDQLPWIEISEENNSGGSAAGIYSSSSGADTANREGRVIRMLGQLEEQGRMAQLLITVQDPLGLDRPRSGPPLLIGSYVRADIEGRPIRDVFPVRREYLRDGSRIWVMNANHELEIRPVNIVFRGKEIVCITEGLSEGERIVTSDIPAPVEGMRLRTEDMPEETFDLPSSSAVQGEP